MSQRSLAGGRSRWLPMTELLLAEGGGRLSLVFFMLSLERGMYDDLIRPPRRHGEEHRAWDLPGT